MGVCQRSEAEKGLQDGDYYYVIEIPVQFSQQATTLLDKEPHPAAIRYVTNDSENYLAAKIGSVRDREAADRDLAAGDESLCESGIRQHRRCRRRHCKGERRRRQAEDGAKSAEQGAEQLRDNVAKLASGTQQLAGGVKRWPAAPAN